MFDCRVIPVEKPSDGFFLVLLVSLQQIHIHHDFLIRRKYRAVSVLIGIIKFCFSGFFSASWAWRNFSGTVLPSPLAFSISAPHDYSSKLPPRTDIIRLELGDFTVMDKRFVVVEAQFGDFGKLWKEVIASQSVLSHKASQL